MNTNKFKYDEENGGGRKHRIRNTSRIASLKNGEAGLRPCVADLFGAKRTYVESTDVEMHTVESVGRPPRHMFTRITEEKNEESPPEEGKSTSQKKSRRGQSSDIKTTPFNLEMADNISQLRKLTIENDQKASPKKP